MRCSIPARPICRRTSTGHLRPARTTFSVKSSRRVARPPKLLGTDGQKALSFAFAKLMIQKLTSRRNLPASLRWVSRVCPLQSRRSSICTSYSYQVLLQASAPLVELSCARSARISRRARTRPW